MQRTQQPYHAARRAGFASTGHDLPNIAIGNLRQNNMTRL
jgi:hypothetical protein